MLNSLDTSNDPAGEIARLRHELALTRTRLEQIQKRKSSLLTMASHDLRTPLAIIQGYSQLLTAELSPAAGTDIAEYLTNILAHIDLLGKMVENLVALDSYERDEIKLTLVRRNLNDVVDHALGQIEGLTVLKNLIIDFEPPVNAAWVRVDEDEIQRAFYNILSHAVKYARPESHLRLSISRGNGFYRVELLDPYRQLTTEILARLFTLAEVGNGGIASMRGMDMGLVLTRYVIERQGGRVEATSEANRGMAIALYLPSDG